MNLKMLCTGAMALSMLTGAALADHGGALDEPTKMAPFYTAADMKTLKSEADFKASWTGLKDEDRATIKQECGGIAADDQNHGAFCTMVGHQ
ncbi:conserved exported hypothetical protein [Mesorhizobium prunaredense]|uniref:Acid stress chaperone HdeA n=1 Tax=Mesorhizobium prunaredense TaxID=1631249 RepID=A0A1R3V6M9_9HYPH|nr:hypothetical protein [Mesorhizobium prunaredense]SIT55490.1 conserved exported hypothetical protein [Mesorhizobium prunaredense]